MLVSSTSAHTTHTKMLSVLGGLMSNIFTIYFQGAFRHVCVNNQRISPSCWCQRKSTYQRPDELQQTSTGCTVPNFRLDSRGFSVCLLFGLNGELNNAEVVPRRSEEKLFSSLISRFAEAITKSHLNANKLDGQNETGLKRLNLGIIPVIKQEGGHAGVTLNKDTHTRALIQMFSQVFDLRLNSNEQT